MPETSFENHAVPDDDHTESSLELSYDEIPDPASVDTDPEPEPIHSLREQILALSTTLARSEGLAFWGAITLYQFMSMIAEGFTEDTVDLERNFARYQIPAVAIPATLIASLHHSGFPKTDELYRVLVSTLSGSGSAAFNLLLSMEVITVIFRAIYSALKGQQVDISDALAWSDIAFCGLAGLGESVQVYCQQGNEANPQDERTLVNRVMTSRAMKSVYGGLNAASAFHAVSFILMSALNSSSKQINSASEFYTRLGITIAAAIAGAYLINLDRADHPISSRVFSTSVMLMQTICLAFFAVGMYFLPVPENTFGLDLRLEQLLLWLLVEPLLSIVTALLVNQFVNRETNHHDSGELLSVTESVRPVGSYLSTSVPRFWSLPVIDSHDGSSDSADAVQVPVRFQSAQC